MEPSVNAILNLAQIIRQVDGSHSLGAGALAEAILSHSDFYSVISNLQDDEENPEPPCAPEGYCTNDTASAWEHGWVAGWLSRGPH